MQDKLDCQKSSIGENCEIPEKKDTRTERYGIAGRIVFMDSEVLHVYS
jgi:hypothetical protein